MSQKLSYQQYKALVEKQANDILDKLAFAATGDLDTSIAVPEGIEALTDLAIGISYLLDDMQALLAEQQEIKGKLEETVAEKTADLAATLADLQAAQQRYTQQAWHHYTTQNDIADHSTAALDESWLVAMTEAVEQKETIAYGGDTSRVAVPVEYSDSLIGVLGFASDEAREWDEEELLAVEGIVEQVGLALENQRLLDQTQQQLAELATINEIAEATSSQLTLEALLPAVGEALIHSFKTTGITIALYDEVTGMISFPYLQYEGFDDLALSPIPISERSLTSKILQDRQPVLIQNNSFYSEDHQLARKIDDKMPDPGSFVAVPLEVGRRAIGVVSLTRSSGMPLFTEEDQRLLGVISRNISVAVTNARLFEQTQERAKQLEALSRIEAALSVAENEQEIVTAVLDNLEKDDIPGGCLLTYLHDPGEALYMDVMSFWQNGRFMPIDKTSMHGLPKEKISSWSVWHQSAGQVIFLEDVQTDARASDALREQGKQQNWRASIILPLRSGRSWQGLFIVNWSERRQFSPFEQFVFRRLLEPLSAIVTSRRARLAQESALAEMESLYEASAQLNISQNYEDIVHALRDYSVFGDDPIFVSLSYFDRVWTSDRPAEAVEVLARYQTVELPNLNRNYRLEQFPSMYNLLDRSKPIMIEDVATDDKVSDSFRQFFIEKIGARSALFVPLVVGQQWVGFVTAFYAKSRQFSTLQLRRPMALAGQAAVATQSLRLLKLAQKRAEREQILRQVTERVRNATDMDLIMKTAVQEVSRALGRPAYIKLETKDN